MTPREALPSSWTDRLQTGPIAIGLDLATSDKSTSNPSGLVVMEDYGGEFIERLVMAFKSADEAITTAMLDVVFNDLTAAGRKVKALVIDATNETFFAQTLQKRFRTRCRVILVKGSEKLKHGSDEMIAKQLLGHLFANAHADGKIASPSATWIKDDRRLVKKHKGLFNSDTNAIGQHGDTWDGGKLALWGLIKRGRVEAEAVAVGTGARAPNERSKHPIRSLVLRLRKRFSNA